MVAAHPDDETLMVGGLIAMAHAKGIEVDVVVPYDRGDLVAAAHEEGEVLSQEHLAEGTRLRARVRPDLAARLGVTGPGGSAEPPLSGHAT